MKSFVCRMGYHDYQEIWIGRVMYDGKHNKAPLYFKGDWQVWECARKGCSEQFGRTVKKRPVPRLGSCVDMMM